LLLTQLQPLSVQGAVLVIPAFCFQFVCQFTAQEMYEQTAYQMYNPMFTSLPIILYGVFDQDVEQSIIWRNPLLYSIGQNNDLFSFKSVAMNWTFSALFSGIFVFLVPLAAAHAHEMTLYELGVYIFSAVVVVVNLRVALLMGSLRLHPLTWFLIIGSTVWYFGYELIVDGPLFHKRPPMSLYTGVAQHAFAYGDFWLGLALVSAVCSLVIWFVQSMPVMFDSTCDDFGDGLVQRVMERDREKMLRGKSFLNEESMELLMNSGKSRPWYETVGTKFLSPTPSLEHHLTGMRECRPSAAHCTATLLPKMGDMESPMLSHGVLEIEQQRQVIDI